MRDAGSRCEMLSSPRKPDNRQLLAESQESYYIDCPSSVVLQSAENPKILNNVWWNGCWLISRYNTPCLGCTLAWDSQEQRMAIDDGLHGPGRVKEPLHEVMSSRMSGAAI